MPYFLVRGIHKKCFKICEEMGRDPLFLDTYIIVFPLQNPFFVSKDIFAFLNKFFCLLVDWFFVFVRVGKLCSSRLILRSLLKKKAVMLLK